MEGREDTLTREEAEKILTECMKVLYYRDARALNKVSFVFPLRSSLDDRSLASSFLSFAPFRSLHPCFPFSPPPQHLPSTTVDLPLRETEERLEFDSKRDRTLTLDLPSSSPPPVPNRDSDR